MKRIFSLAISTLFLLPAVSCALSAKETTIQRTVNASWNQAGTRILAIESSYLTPDVSEKPFYATKSHDWMYTLVSLDANGENRTVLESWADVYSTGTIQYSPIYYVESKNLLVYKEADKNYLLDLGTKARTTLIPDSDMVLVEFLPLKLSRDDIAFNEAVPSPDENYLALWIFVGYDASGGLFIPDIRTKNAVAFYNLNTAAFESIVAVPWIDDSPVRYINPLDAGSPNANHFLWSKDSKAVYAMGWGESYAVYMDKTVTAQESVPEIPNPTKGGVISDSGMLLKIIDADTTTTRLVLEQQTDFTPFDSIPLVPFASIRYAN